MRKLLLLTIVSSIILSRGLEPSISTGLFAQASEAPFNTIQFKGTHNSYWLSNSPREQIDNYNIWRFELDFGVLPASPDFIVGHDYPEEKFGLRTLEDWVLSIKAANSTNYHPIILKLEAKTDCSCGWFLDPCSSCWGWADISYWGDWQNRLRENLKTWLGEENWLTKGKFENDYLRTWPSASKLKGKFIIMLIDNHGNQHVQNDEFFFTEGIPDISDPEAFDQGQFNNALKSNPVGNVFVMDNQYLEPWSNVLMHPPVPAWVIPFRNTGWQWGTLENPFITIGHAIDANWTQGGEPTNEDLRIATGTYLEKVTISTPVTLHAQNGPATIGGSSVSYSIVVRLMDVHEAGTSDPVYVKLNGSSGSTSEYQLSNPVTYFDRNGIETFWVTGQDIGDLQSITVRVGGGNDIYVDDIFAYSARTGRYFSGEDAWVGNDHINPRRFVLSR